MTDVMNIQFGGRCEKHLKPKPCPQCLEESTNAAQQERKTEPAGLFSPARRDLLGRVTRWEQVDAGGEPLYLHPPAQQERKPDDELNRLRTALERIARWHGEFPDTGAFWDKEKTRPVSFGSEYGSNGERDYMRQLAVDALKETP